MNYEKLAVLAIALGAFALGISFARIVYSLCC